MCTTHSFTSLFLPRSLPPSVSPSLPLSYSERLAYDWVTEKIYWSDYGAAEIGVVDVNTGTRTVLITTGVQQHSRPKALALDPIRR